MGQNKTANGIEDCWTTLHNTGLRGTLREQCMDNVEQNGRGSVYSSWIAWKCGRPRDSNETVYKHRKTGQHETGLTGLHNTKLR